MEAILRLLRVFHHASVELPGLGGGGRLDFQVKTLETIFITTTIEQPTLEDFGGFNTKHSV